MLSTSSEESLLTKSELNRFSDSKCAGNIVKEESGGLVNKLWKEISGVGFCCNLIGLLIPTLPLFLIHLSYSLFFSLMLIIFVMLSPLFYKIHLGIE